jgi:hypothetical protein
VVAKLSALGGEQQLEQLTTKHWWSSGEASCVKIVIFIVINIRRDKSAIVLAYNDLVVIYSIDNTSQCQYM